MSTVEKSIRLYAWKTNYQSFRIVEGEVSSRTFNVQLFGTTMPVNLSNCLVKFFAIKPDSTRVYIDAPIQNAELGRVQVTIPKQLGAVDGIVDCWIQVLGDGTDLRFEGMSIEVSDCSLTDDIESSDDFSALVEALASVIPATARANDAAQFAETSGNYAKRVGEDVLESKNSGQFDGKSAYDYAKDAGYTGTEEEFTRRLMALSENISSRRIALDANLNTLLETGRYYYTAGDPGGYGFIRSLLTDAGIELPVNVSNFQPKVLFVDVVRQERKANDPTDVVGMPTQYVTVVFETVQTEEFDSVVLQYYRIHQDRTGSYAKGDNWGKWFSATSQNTDIFVATYEETTFSQVSDAYAAGKICFCRKEQEMLPLITLVREPGRGATFAGWHGNSLFTNLDIIQLSLLDTWTIRTKTVTTVIDSTSTDNQFPSAKAVYDFVTAQLSQSSQMPNAEEVAY